VQPQMLAGLVKRAAAAGLDRYIHPQLSQADRIGVSEPIDFALAFWMVHEVKPRRAFLQEIYALLKPGGKLLIVEPIIHVSAADFARTIALGQEIGFQAVDRPRIALSRAILFGK